MKHIKEEQLLRALSEVDEKYIAAAAPGMPHPAKNRWIRLAAMAACLCVIVGAAMIADPISLWRSDQTHDMVEKQAMMESEQASLEAAQPQDAASDGENAAEERVGSSESAATEDNQCAVPQTELDSSAGFDTMLANRGQENIVDVVICVEIPIGARTAQYEQVHSVDCEELRDYIGVVYLEESEDNVWYYPAGKHNCKYLIRVQGEELSLWVFRSFVVTDTTYTYGDVCREIYGLKRADQIVSITAAPSTANNTEFGQKIQTEIGTTVYEEQADLEQFYAIIQTVRCYGEQAHHDSAERQYTYSFSTEDPDKLSSGEAIYGTRELTVLLEDGTTIESWNYDALRGCFYEFGGIETEALPEQQVQTLNALFGIS